MGEFRFKISGDGRPVFTSNGIKVLFASGSDTQVTMLEPDVLVEKYGAELVLDNVTLNPYWQINECTGAIYRLTHFPLDDSEFDYEGLYVFNVVPSEEYKKACKEPNVIAVGSVCDIVVGCSFFQGSWGRNFDEWFFEMPEDISSVVDKANKYLQTVIDKLQEK